MDGTLLLEGVRGSRNSKEYPKRITHRWDVQGWEGGTGCRCAALSCHPLPTSAEPSPLCWR